MFFVHDSEVFWFTTPYVSLSVFVYALFKVREGCFITFAFLLPLRLAGERTKRAVIEIRTQEVLL